jgi:HK97 family phage portal protein
MADKYRIDVMSAFNEKGMPLDAWHDFITGPHDDNQETLINIDRAYRCVPWLNRGVNLRADAVAHMPYHIETTAGADVTEREEWEYLTDKMRRLLALTEKSLVKRGCAYWLIESNRVGKKQTPRYIPARSVRLVTDDQQGIVGYEITWSSGTRKYPKAQVVYFCIENDDSEIAPDVAPAQVALEAAGLLYASNAAPARFYSGGFVPVSLIAVPLTTQKSDITKLEAFFRRAGTGLKNMFNVLGVYEGVKVEQVGHTLKDSITPDITSSARDDVAVALGIPPTVLDSTSANYATASSEMIGFYVNTIFPECSMIQETVNEQFFTALGLRFVFDMQQHEIMQTIQLAQGQSVVTLTGKPPLTVDEGREMLGYEAGEGPEEVEPEATGTTDETAAPQDSTTPASTNGTETINDLSLNGAQITAALNVINQLAMGEIAPDVAVELLVAVGIQREKAQQMVNDTLKNPISKPTDEAAADAELVKALIDEMQASRKVLENGNGQH